MKSTLVTYLKFLLKKILFQIDPKIEINRCYRNAFNKMPNLNNPQDLIEKIYWMELNTDTSLWTKCADKYLMREYVKECGCESYLPKLLAKWDSAAEMDFSSLPNEFILKTNNGCETCYIVHDKYKEDILKVKHLFNKWMKIEFGYAHSQIHYLGIKPCIIAEELLSQSSEEKKFSPSSLVDYKVWCINGIPESIWVAYDRKEEYVGMDLYDTKWNRMPDKLVSINHYRYNESIHIPKPICLDEMLQVATTLSKPFPEVRVDFYVINNKPIVGELTFSTGYGYFTYEYYGYLGNKTDISKLRGIH